jgi:hypothetical protein
MTLTLSFMVHAARAATFALVRGSRYLVAPV